MRWLVLLLWLSASAHAQTCGEAVCGNIIPDVQTRTDGAINATSTTLTSVSAPFVLADAGKLIYVVGAGPGGTDLATTIGGYISATQIALSAAASTSVTGKRITWGTDNTNQLNTAIVASNSGIIDLPLGGIAVSGTINLNVGTSRTLRGQGKEASELYDLRPTGTTINATTTAGAPFNRIEHLGLLAGHTTVDTPLSVRTGSVGILASGVNAGLVINDVRIQYYGETGIKIAGPTGPTILQDVYGTFIGGYAITLTTLGGVGNADVTIDHGAFHLNAGGILVNTAYQAHINSPDIELDTLATLPCITVSNSSDIALREVTCSIGAIPTPAALLWITGTSDGTLISGGDFGVPAGVTMVQMDNGTRRNTIIGGRWISVSSAGGFFATVAGTAATDTIVIGTDRVNFTVGKDIVSGLSTTARLVCIKTDGSYGTCTSISGSTCTSCQ